MVAGTNIQCTILALVLLLNFAPQSWTQSPEKIQHSASYLSRPSFIIFQEPNFLFHHVWKEKGRKINRQKCKKGFKQAINWNLPISVPDRQRFWCLCLWLKQIPHKISFLPSNSLLSPVQIQILGCVWWVVAGGGWPGKFFWSACLIVLFWQKLSFITLTSETSSSHQQQESGDSGQLQHNLLVWIFRVC